MSVLTKLLKESYDLQEISAEETAYWHLQRLRAAIKNEQIKRESEEPSMHSDYFSFAKYLYENFDYVDNTDLGDVYRDYNKGGLYSEKDIYNEWLNNR